MTTSPAVSVIIPCFNHGEFLPQAVASVGSLNRPDVEIIVVDDGSTDQKTKTAIAALTNDGLHVIKQVNMGLAAARNAGISASGGKYILTLDADNRIRPEYIEQGIQILDANSKIGIVYGDAELFGTASGRWRLGPFNGDRLMRGNFIDACAVFRRAVWEQNNGYDGTMPVQGLEDWDFWLGAFEHGWEFMYVPEVLFDYRKSSDSMITRAAGHEQEVAIFIARKHGPLYRDAWLQLARQQESGRATARNLRRLVQLRVTQRFRRNGRSV